MDWNVACGGIVLEQIEDKPTGGIREADIERNGVGGVLASQVDGGLAARGNQALEAALVREIEQNAREGNIVFDDEEHAVAGLNLGAIVLDFHGSDGGVARTRRCEQNIQLLLGGSGTRLQFRQIRGGNIRLRQVESKVAARAGTAGKPDLPTQQTSEIAADGKAQAGSTVLSAGGAIRLLEGFKNNFLLVGGDSNTGIHYGERQRGFEAAQDRVSRRPSASDVIDAQRDRSSLGEFQRVGHQVLEDLL